MTAQWDPRRVDERQRDGTLRLPPVAHGPNVQLPWCATDCMIGDGGARAR